MSRNIQIYFFPRILNKDLLLFFNIFHTEHGNDSKILLLSFPVKSATSQFLRK
jgi:hypothetical protein